MLLNCVGPMPPADFIFKLLPRSEFARPSTVQFKLEKSQRENDVDISIEAEELCAHLRFFQMSRIGDNLSSSDDNQPTTCVIALFKSRSPDTPQRSDTSQTNLQGELLIEYVRRDPFKDPDASKVKNRKRFGIRCLDRASKQGFTRHMKFVKTILEAHSHAFFFSVLVMDDAARLIRWDRSGVIVTERFAWASDSNPLTEFLWQFDRMAPEGRGLDITSTLPSAHESELARAAFARSNKIAVSPEDRLRKLSVHDDATGRDHFYIVASPQSSHGSLFGSCTTGYVAFDLSHRALVWLKDSWKSQSSSVPKEGDIYRRMMEKGVPHVPDLYCAGDVGSQRTICKNFVKAEWACARMNIGTYRHYRLVLGEIGRPLEMFTSTYELCMAVRDAVEAHAWAYRELNILHGDISSGNILITDSGRGLLVDWELAFDVAVGRSGSVIGTWNFISAALMEDPRKTEHHLVDDLESFLHVLVFHLLRHRPTGILNLIDILDNIYYSGISDDEPELNGMHKMCFLSGGLVRLAQIRGYLNEPCFNLLVELRQLFWRGRYAEESSVARKERREMARALESSDRVLAMFDAAVNGSGWPSGDGSRDIVKEIREETKLRKSGMMVSAGKRTASVAFGDPQESGPQKKQRSSSRGSDATPTQDIQAESQ